MWGAARSGVYHTPKSAGNTGYSSRDSDCGLHMSLMRRVE